MRAIADMNRVGRLGAGGRCAAVLMALLLLASCSASTTIDENVGSVAIATEAPAPEPTAVPPTVEPTAAPPPPPTAEPTVTPPPPEPTPEPTPEPPTELPVGALGEVRSLASLDDAPLPYDDFVRITDDSQALSFEVPASFADLNRTQWQWDGALVGSALAASPDLESFYTLWDTPGLFVGASSELPFATADEFLDEIWFGESCDDVVRRPYDDGNLIGLFDLYVTCGPEESALLEMAVSPVDSDHLMEVQFVLVTERDWAVVTTVLDTLTLDGSRT